MKKLFFGLFFFLFLATQVHAEPASLSFDPITIKTAVGEVVPVKVNIYTGKQPVASTDVWISYNKEYLQPLSEDTENGDLFQKVEAKVITPGNLYLFGVQENQKLIQPVTGTVATVYFKAVKEGTAELRFDCASYKQLSSQIIKAEGTLQNIISCPSTLSHSSMIEVGPRTSILGADSVRFQNVNIIYLVMTIVIVFMTLYLFIKYQRLNKHH